jgi:acyl-CoA thioesterase
MTTAPPTPPPRPAQPADLAKDTAPLAIAPHHWRIELAPAWSYLHPSGGAVVTAALRAARAELADHSLELASTTTVFCTPIPAGPLDAEVTVLRRGKSTAQVRIAMHLPGASRAVAAETLATFCRDRPGPDLVGAAFPPVPLPDDCDDADNGNPVNPHGRFAFYANVDCKIARGGRYWLPDFAAGPPRFARWFRYRVPQRTAAGVLDRLALPPIADTMPTALLEALGPSSYRFFAPSLDLTLHVVDDTDREWILASTYCRRARAGWATAEVELWDDTRRLIAYGTQAMYLHGTGGTPPAPIDASGR